MQDSDPTESTQFFVAGMPWGRHTRYEIKDDVIRPSPGARLIYYDPWQVYHAASRKRPRAESPYRELLDLAEKLEFEWTRGIGRLPRGPTAESEKRILHWCNRYGLLGILPALTRTITLTPCWTPLSEPTTPPKKFPTLVPAYRTYLRDGGAWRVITHFGGLRAARPLDEKAKQEGEPIPKKLVPKEWPHPGASQRDWRSFKWKDNNPLQGEFLEFFPQVPQGKAESYQYPVPGTEEFWNVYAEPVEVFTNWALKFKSCAETVTRLGGKRRRTKDENEQLKEVASFLNSLTSSVCPSADVEPGRFTRRWASASLVGSLAFMFVLDQEAGKRSRACLNEKCRTWFISDSSKALYCSPTCRGTVQMRRYRKKHPKGGKQHAKTRRKRR